MRYPVILTKDGKKVQHVPIVLKNRDVLIGYLRAYNDMMGGLNDLGLVDFNDVETLTELAPMIDSSRFNNIVQDGVDASKLSDEQLEELKKEELETFDRQGTHPENKDNILEVGFFSIDCDCGNFVSFKTPKDIPEDNFQCDICERTLIQYIHVEDEEIEIDVEKE